MNTKRSTLFILVIFQFHILLANVTPAGVFSDNMVLQRNAHVPIWGKADPGEIVNVQIAGQSVSSTTNDDGKWEVILNPVKAGGPYKLTIKGNNEITFENVLYGDVWLASGQSNMEWDLKSNVNNYEEEIANADYPEIRLFNVPRNIDQQPVEDVKEASWQVCSPEVVGDFSAVGYFFGREIYKSNDVPIGVLESSWGGSPAEAWTSYEMLGSVDHYADESAKYASGEVNWEKDLDENAKRSDRKNDILNNSYKGIEEGILDRKYNDFNWDVVEIPGWDKQSKNVIWIRKSFEVPKQFKNQSLTLHIGQPNGKAEVYFNEEKIYTDYGPRPIEVEVSGDFVKSGKNAIVIRLANGWGLPSMSGKANDMFVATSSGVRVADLSGIWKYNETLEPEVPEAIKYFQYPAALFNGMINPIIPYAIKGAIWYQGESNASEADAPHYYELFSAMINDWRVRWKQGHFPFLFVQLANYMNKDEQPSESSWARLRDEQLETLKLPNTGMAVTIDIGEAYNIHPKNKQDVGKRLALAAEKVAYHKDIVYSGPVYKSYEINGTEIEINFEHFGSGLKAKGGELKGFAIAGKDKKFVWADAQIVGGKVIVSSPKVSDPVAVRYAWGDNPDATLYNKDGLPASPFRTDDW